MMKIQSVGESKMGKIWVLGDAVVDLIPEGENTYLRCAGGARECGSRHCAFRRHNWLYWTSGR